MLVKVFSPGTILVLVIFKVIFYVSVIYLMIKAGCTDPGIFERKYV